MKFGLLYEMETIKLFGKHIIPHFRGRPSKYEVPRSRPTSQAPSPATQVAGN